jgi:diguanylate cyclase (GGDEF)-like protein
MSRGSLKQRATATGRVVVDRLAWPGRGDLTRAFEDPATMARTFTYLFGVGATLLLVSLALPHPSDRDTAGLLAIAAVAYASSIAFLALYDRLPGWGFQVAPLWGTILISLGVYFGGSDAADAYAMYYVWVAVAACYFLKPVIAAAHLVLASAAYGIVLLVAPETISIPALKWVLATGTLFVVGILITALRSQMERLMGQLAEAARTDALTGLANRRELEGRFAAELERSTRTGRPLSILVLDLDWFKEFNDRFGHSAGDGALLRLAEALRRATRTSDIVARLGGEEFAVLAPETDEEEGFLLAERLRAEVRTAFAREPENLTISCGLASFPLHGIASGELLHAADRALYEAKESGRNRSVVFRHAPGEEREKVSIERSSPRLASLVSLAEAVDRRKGSPANSRRVARFAERIARTLNLPEEEVDRVRVAALLRDVGEVGVAESILSKAGPLTDEERRELERHPEMGARIVGAAQLGRVGEWILTHHERPDGRGYPRGLREHQIPLEGRILAVADAYGAMTADRPYRRPFSAKRAKAELQARAGSQFDHEVVEAFLSLNEELESEAGSMDGASDRVPEIRAGRTPRKDT